MGILDDAIREHLELKRAHGAAEEEVAFKEAEAFGPVRQDAAAAAPLADETQLLAPDQAAPAHDLQVEPAVPDPHDHAHTEGADPAWGEDTEFFAEPAAEPAPEVVAVEPDALVADPDAPPAAEAGAGTLEPSAVEPGPPPPADHGSGHEEPHPALHDRDAIHSEEHAPEPVFREPPAAYETPAPAPVPIEDPVEPAPVEEPPVVEPPIEVADEDVLEETPEFLQDAPEHDRLWFEQKPPRDFDFGE